MDIYINNEGDILVDKLNNDIYTIKDGQQLAQMISLAINEDEANGLVTIYPTNLSELNGSVINEETINEIQEKIKSAIYVVSPTLKVTFKDPIVTSDQNLIILFKVSYGDKYIYNMILYYSSNKIFVNYVN